jgi:hypothetical protein
MARRRKEPALSPEGAAAEALRQARLAAALRENLLRRKAQKRGRGDAGRQDEAGQRAACPAQPLESGPKVK